MGELQVVSILLEALVLLICASAVFSKKKTFMLGFALTYAIYVFYDAAKLFSFSVPAMLLEGIFFVATLSALWSVWQIYNQKKN